MSKVQINDPKNPDSEPLVSANFGKGYAGDWVDIYEDNGIIEESETHHAIEQLQDLINLRNGGKSGPLVMGGSTYEEGTDHRVKLHLEEYYYVPTGWIFKKRETTVQEVEVTLRWEKGQASIDQKFAVLPTPPPPPSEPPVDLVAEMKSFGSSVWGGLRTFGTSLTSHASSTLHSIQSFFS